MTLLITGATGQVSPALLTALSRFPDIEVGALVRDPRKALDLPDVESGLAHGRNWGDFATTAVRDLLGREPRSFAAFALDHANALRPGAAR